MMVIINFRTMILLSSSRYASYSLHIDCRTVALTMTLPYNCFLSIFYILNYGSTPSLRMSFCLSFNLHPSGNGTSFYEPVDHRTTQYHTIQDQTTIHAKLQRAVHKVPQRGRRRHPHRLHGPSRGL